MVTSYLTKGMVLGSESSQLDLSDKGKDKHGQTISLDAGVMQCWLTALARTPAPLIEDLEQANLDGVLYADINDPQGIALLTLHENPDYSSPSSCDSCSTNCPLLA